MTLLKTYGMDEEAREFLRGILNYDSRTGLFTWKQAISKRIKVNEQAGTLTPKGRVITIRGVPYTAHRLAWLFVYGRWPTAVRHKNEDKDDNRIDNLFQ